MPEADSVLMRLDDVRVSLRFGSRDIRALDGVSLTVRPEDRVAVMGASGAGKSTLLHVMSRLITPTSGRLVLPQASGLPSLVFQFPEYQLFSETVGADVAYGLRQSGVAPTAIEARVSQALRDVGLPPQEFATRVPFHLSGGEQRRVALAGALAQRRPLLLLDEPTLGLDRSGVVALQRILAGLRGAGTATWIASHDAEFLGATCDTLVVLEAGRVAYQGPWGEFWEDDERARHLGIRPPRRARLRVALRELGDADLPPHPEESELVAALSRLLPSAGNPADGGA